MLSDVKHHAQATVTRAAHTAALGAVATVTLIVGLGFLTLAAWLVLTTLMTTTQAALTLGSAYLGVSLLTLVVMAVRSKGSTPQQASTHPEPSPMGEVISAFAGGVSAGRQARAPR